MLEGELENYTSNMRKRVKKRRVKTDLQMSHNKEKQLQKEKEWNQHFGKVTVHCLRREREAAEQGIDALHRDLTYTQNRLEKNEKKRK